MRMASALKAIVSKKKKRFIKDGFNLDLSYINERIIAMGFPAENVESLYRNSLDDVKRFLEEKHSGHYKIYNLCSERFYDSKKFHNRVANYPFDDHHPPDFSIIQPFCKDVDSWLQEDERNVAVVHCKAGKGRTGVMICCYLLHSGKYETAEDVLKFYGQQRTMDHKGVTIPSQRRYINYYANVIRNQVEYRPVKLYLRSIVLAPVPNFGNMPGGNEFYLSFEVKQAASTVYRSPDYLLKRTEKHVQFELERPVLVCSDVKVEFSSKMKMDMIGIKSKFMQPKKEFHFWYNTYFVDSAFSSGLCHSVNADALSVSQRRNHNSSNSSSSEDNHSIELSNGHGFHHHHPTRTIYPPPERHASAENATSGGGGSSDSNSSGVNSTTNLMKLTSISDDHLLQQQQHQQQQQNVAVTLSSPPGSGGAATATAGGGHHNNSTTTQSFIEKRIRHSSVPQTTAASRVSNGPSVASSQSQQPYSNPRLEPPPIPVDIKGTPVSLHLTKLQIDKVHKDKQCKVCPDDFKVTLFLLRPTDQSDAMIHSSSPICRMGGGLAARLNNVSSSPSSTAVVGSSNLSSKGGSSPESSSEEETDSSDANKAGVSDGGCIQRLNSYQPPVLATERVNDNNSSSSNKHQNVRNSVSDHVTSGQQHHQHHHNHHHQAERVIQSDWI